jgi:hypothetical protein
MNNKLTTPKAILIGSLMIAGTILYTSGNISNPIIGTAHASSHENHQLNYFSQMIVKLTYITDLLQLIEKNTR